MSTQLNRKKTSDLRRSCCCICRSPCFPLALIDEQYIYIDKRLTNRVFHYSHVVIFFFPMCQPSGKKRAQSSTSSSLLPLPFRPLSHENLLVLSPINQLATKKIQQSNSIQRCKTIITNCHHHLNLNR